MKEYLLIFSDSSMNKRKLWTNNELKKFSEYIGKKDKNGIILLSIEPVI